MPAAKKAITIPEWIEELESKVQRLAGYQNKTEKRVDALESAVSSLKRPSTPSAGISRMDQSRVVEKVSFLLDRLFEEKCAAVPRWVLDLMKKEIAAKLFPLDE